MTDVPANRTPRTSPPFAIPARLDGRVVLPGDARYEAARLVDNAAIDRRPAVIAECVTTDDVAASVAFGREQGLEISIRGGGHSSRPRRR